MYWRISVPEAPLFEDFLKKLIEPDLRKRIGVKEYLNHSFWTTPIDYCKLKKKIIKIQWKV